MGRRRRVDAAVDDFAVRTAVTASQPSRSSRGYDRLAAFYHRIEWMVFGDQLQHARTALVDELPPWSRLLILGDGNGRLLEHLLAQRASRDRHSFSQPRLGRITSVDQSMQMLRRQRARVQSLGMDNDVEFIHTEACGFVPRPGVYDVMVTPFFLDCFTTLELDEYLPRWLSGLHPGGLLYHVDFIVPQIVLQSVWQRWRAQSLLWAMHLFFRWQTGLENRQLVDTEAALARCGLRKQTQRIGGGGMITTQIWRRVNGV